LNIGLWSFFGCWSLDFGGSGCGRNRTCHQWEMKLSIVGLLMIGSMLFAADQGEIAIIQTSDGDMVVEFWNDAAPKTIDNFKKLARSGFYDGTTFHRIMKDFMIQGGDPLSKDPAKEEHYGDGGPGYQIPAEFNHHDHVRGVISMAREDAPDTAGSQFFICLAPVPRLNGKYTTFGKLINGDEVLTKISEHAVRKNSAGEMSKPLDRVVIKTVKIVPASSAR